MFDITTTWKTVYPDAHVGILVMHHVDNPPTCPELERAKQDLEDQLRAQFNGQDRKALDAISAILAYNAYFKQFKKTYHIQAQLESIVFKGRAIPNVSALVAAMFMAEVKNLLLTAGHDLDSLLPPVMLGVASGNERYTLLRGQEQVLKAGDMMMADQGGVISSIVYGPDQRTQIRAQTHNVVFTVYAPVGISTEAVHMHLHDICGYVWLVSPAASVKVLEVYGA